MAIYSLHHQPIGKTTQQRPHTAAAHIRYITRPSALSRVDAARMPLQAGRAASYLRRGEDADRKNARVADKILLALPVELDAAQRARLVRDFAEDVTQRRAPWLAAFHERGKDAHNPHVHLVIRDRDPDTGKRVCGLSDKGSTERLRALWETHANQALERAGHDARIDRRTLDAQGIRREPTIHEGPRAQQMDRRGARPTSRRRDRRNAPGARSPAREVDYRKIDDGRSRPAYNRSLREADRQVEYWAAIDAFKRDEDFKRLRAIHHPPTSMDVERAVGPLLAGPLLGLDKKRAEFGHVALPLFQQSLRVSPVLGFQAGAAVPHPSADEGQAKENRPDDVLGKQRQPADNTGNHISIIGKYSAPEKGHVMEEFDKILQKHREDVAQKEFQHNTSRSLLDTAIKQAFQDHEAARAKMEKYARQQHSRGALYDKLAAKPGTFGLRPGSILSTDGYKRGAEAQRRDADIARRHLPSVMRDADDKRAELANARKAYEDALARYGSKEQTKMVEAGQGLGSGQVPGSSQGAAAERGPSAGQARDPDLDNKMGMAAAREKLAREQHPGYSRATPRAAEPEQGMSPAVPPNDEQLRRMMDQMRDRDAGQAKAAGQTPDAKRSADPDRQNNAAMLEARERLAREQHPSYTRGAPNSSTPSQVVEPSPAPQTPQAGNALQSDEAARRMMDRMRDRQALEKELEQKKGRGIG